MWLVLSSQWWFLIAALDPRVDLPFRLGATLSIVFLVAGIVLAVRRPHRMLWWAAASALLSVGFVALGAAFQGVIPHDLPGWAATALFSAFGISQIVCLVTLVWRSSGARWAAAMLAGFCLPYALWSYFVAGMAFSDTWV